MPAMERAPRSDNMASKLTNLSELITHELKDLASAEDQLTKALPKMARSAKSEELKQAFLDHLEQTEQHLARVTELLEGMGESRGRAKCLAMAGIIAEGEKVIKEKAEPAVHDAALICAAQRVEHYEIAGYGCIRAFAELLGKADVVEVISGILEEEKAADHKLTEIARTINVEAAEGDENGQVVVRSRSTARSR
jgi:ferritin-like metal-binding protein YciE